MAARWCARSNELHATRRGKAVRSAEDFVWCAIDRRFGFKLFSGRGGPQGRGYRKNGPNRAIRVGRGLSRSNRSKAEEDRRLSLQLWRRAEVLCRYRAYAGTRPCGARWYWLARQEHHAHRSDARDLV